jgi:hypothetical protein
LKPAIRPVIRQPEFDSPKIHNQIARLRLMSEAYHLATINQIT